MIYQANERIGIRILLDNIIKK